MNKDRELVPYTDDTYRYLNTENSKKFLRLTNQLLTESQEWKHLRRDQERKKQAMEQRIALETKIATESKISQQEDISRQAEAPKTADVLAKEKFLEELKKNNQKRAEIKYSLCRFSQRDLLIACYFYANCNDSQSFKTIRILLNSGKTDINDTSLYGVAPIHIAAYFKEKNFIQFLISNGAKTDLPLAPSRLSSIINNPWDYYGDSFRLDMGRTGKTPEDLYNIKLLSRSRREYLPLPVENFQSVAIGDWGSQILKIFVMANYVYDQASAEVNKQLLPLIFSFLGRKVDYQIANEIVRAQGFYSKMSAEISEFPETFRLKFIKTIAISPQDSEKDNEKTHKIEKDLDQFIIADHFSM